MIYAALLFRWSILAKWMGVDAPDGVEKESRVIITEFNNILIGFVVHEAKRIRRVNWKDIEPASFISGDGGLDGSKITGVTRIEDDSVLLILDLEGVVQELGFINLLMASLKRENIILAGLFYCWMTALRHAVLLKMR